MYRHAFNFNKMYVKNTFADRAVPGCGAAGARCCRRPVPAMPLLYKGGGRYTGGGERGEPLCTRVARPRPQPQEETSAEPILDPLPSQQEQPPLPVPPPAPAAVSKKRKFSFKRGKLSVTEEPELLPGRIYLEVEGREIAVEENCLTSNSRHFNRILEDISNNINSEYLEPEEEEEYEEEEEEEEDNPLSFLPYEPVAALVDFIGMIQLSRIKGQKFMKVANIKDYKARYDEIVEVVFSGEGERAGCEREQCGRVPAGRPPSWRSQRRACMPQVRQDRIDRAKLLGQICPG